MKEVYMPINKTRRRKWTANNKQNYFMAMCGVLFLLVFSYAPMFGIMLAFKNGDRAINVFQALIQGKWVHFKNFTDLFSDRKFVDILLNTIGLNMLMLLINFPAPIIFALLVNEIRHKKFKKTIQIMTMFPHFISWIIFGGIIIALTDMTTGVVNPILEALRISNFQNPINLGSAEYFWAEMIIASLVKGVGWGSIIYLAAIAGINPELYEAAEIDGAGRFHKAIKITLPMIAPTITVFLLLQISKLLGNSYEQFYSLQNPINLDRSEVLSTYIYFKGITQRRYSYASALGLFESAISVVLLIVSNLISKKTTGRGIF